MLPIEGYLTTDDGVKLYFQKFGSGSHAVIVPNAVHMFESFQHLGENRTIVFFDLRNRGKSESIRDASKLARGIHNDVEDLEAVRRHFEIDQVDLIGHSYLGLLVILYAIKYPDHVRRIIQIGPAQPNAATQYPPHLTGFDATMAAFLAKLSQHPAQPRDATQPVDSAQGCRQFWDSVRVLMVADAADASKIAWTPCECPNEVNFMTYWTQHLQPSIQALRSAEQLSEVKAPVLVVHGRRDRQAPYGGGREWSMKLPSARLVTVENAAHVPWIEAPQTVFGAIEVFLNGAWPAAGEVVESLDVPLK